MKQPSIIGVSGGSGSGKTYFCKQLLSRYEEGDVLLISADHYFKKKLPKMISPLTQKEYDDWNSVESVDYEAVIEEVQKAAKAKVKGIIIEGVTVFSCDTLRKMMDLKVFIDTDIELRLYRRIKRNMAEFHMQIDEIATYFIEAAKFQEERYSISTKLYADVIFNGAREFDVPLQIMDLYLRSVFR